MTADPSDDLQTLMAGLPDPAVITDEVLRPVWHNTAFSAMLGLRRRALETALAQCATVFDILATPAVSLVSQATAALDSGRAIRMDELLLQLPEERDATVSVSIIPVQQASQRRLVVVLRDVTAEAKVQARYKEMLALERARGGELERAVAERTGQLQSALEEVTRLSRTDPLTGLPNRRSFFEFADGVIELAQRHNRVVGILICDLDHFKRVNDTFGHDAGDKLLVASAQALQEAVRRSDRVARYGGEEFVILLTEMDHDSAGIVAARCNVAVRDIPLAEMIPTGQPQTISIGVAMFPDHGGSVQEVLKSADLALYEAKRTGRDRVVVYTPAFGQPKTTLVGQKLLWLSSGGVDAPMRSTVEGLEIVTVTTTTAAHDVARRDSLTAVLVDSDFEAYPRADDLGEIFRLQPDAVRILLIDGAADTVNIRGEALGFFDGFLLKRDLPELGHVIEEMRLRRQVRDTRSSAAPCQCLSQVTNGPAAIERVLREGQLFMVYQPIVSMRGAAPLGVEALCRVPDRRFADPVEFFRHALAAGLLWRCSREVRARVAGDIGRLPPDQLVFVNLHPGDFDDETFLAGEAFLAPVRHRVVFELTERAAVPNLDRFVEVTKRLRDLGFRLAVDDLGAGYATLNTVAMVEPEFIKIDMTLTRGIQPDNCKGKLVRRLVEYANDAGAQVIAEGVETPSEEETIRALGCHFGQGYYFGRPERLP